MAAFHFGAIDRRIQVSLLTQTADRFLYRNYQGPRKPGEGVNNEEMLVLVPYVTGQEKDPVSSCTILRKMTFVVIVFTVRYSITYFLYNRTHKMQ